MGTANFIDIEAPFKQPNKYRKQYERVGSEEHRKNVSLFLLHINLNACRII